MGQSCRSGISGAIVVPGPCQNREGNRSAGRDAGDGKSRFFRKVRVWDRPGIELLAFEIANVDMHLIPLATAGGVLPACPSTRERR